MQIQHIDTCLSSFLHDHHNRDGECLFGVYVDGTTTRADLLQGLLDEMRSTGDRVPDHAGGDMDAWDAMKACAKSLFSSRYGTSPEALGQLFDSSLDVPSEEERETLGGDEMPQAWFLLTWDEKEGEAMPLEQLTDQILDRLEALEKSPEPGAEGNELPALLAIKDVLAIYGYC